MSITRTLIVGCLALALLWTLPASAAQVETVEYDGLIEPYQVINVGTPEEGILARVSVERADQVKSGQVLAELESSVARAALEKARAVSGFDGEIALQETRLAYAERVHKRIKDLAAIAAQEKDQAASEVATAQQSLKKAEERKAEARLDQKLAQARLERCSIKSPISGVVVERYVSPGEYVNSQPLLRVAQIDPLRVEVILPAQHFGRVQPGMTAIVVPELQSYGERTATVAIVDRLIDAASNTFGVRLSLQNTDGQLPAGLKCTVRFALEATGAAPKPEAAKLSDANADETLKSQARDEVLKGSKSKGSKS